MWFAQQDCCAIEVEELSFWGECSKNVKPASCCYRWQPGQLSNQSSIWVIVRFAMWLQTPLVCCTVDHMSTLKRICGVSPSGAEISVNSWVLIFLPPGCWEARSQSRGLRQLLWAAQLNSELTDPGSVWHRAAHQDREQAVPLTSMKAWWVMPAASMCTHSLKNMIMLQSVIVKYYFQKVTLNVYIFFFSSLL